LGFPKRNAGNGQQKKEKKTNDAIEEFNSAGQGRVNIRCTKKEGRFDKPSLFASSIDHDGEERNDA